MALQAVVLIAYFASLLPLAVLGLHRLALVWLRTRPDPDAEPEVLDTWPMVTVQVPLYNERYVAERIIGAVAALDYPRDRLEIQVLDDSTDDTRDRVDRVAHRLRRAGAPIEVLRREQRVGFKAGALEAGMRRARGSLIAVLDADFVPEPDFLRRMVPWFREDVGMVQARWGHLNAEESWLTRAQATLLDGHFVTEHGARYRSGRWFNFNGTAGVWRRQAIEDAGGWEHDTLTEDLDLSYRAQLAGWRFVYRDEVVVRAELPADMGAFKAQQNRWARGGIQVARKLLGRIWRSRVPLRLKVEASFHLLSNLAYPLLVALAALLPFAVWARGSGVAPALLGLDVVLFLAATVSVFVFYGAAVLHLGGRGTGVRLWGLPVVMALGLGLAIAQTRAVWQGVTGSVGCFARTPKKGGASRREGYGARSDRVLVLEALMAVWQLVGLGWAVQMGWVASLPFMALFAAGYLAVVLQAVIDAGRSRGRRADRTVRLAASRDGGGAPRRQGTRVLDPR
ncbi:MAG: glycosyltransferase [Deltaproteobacteria bacterium]|nr:glycosyltransferase [Deltaproteobacteria bacterium]